MMRTKKLKAATTFMTAQGRSIPKSIFYLVKWMFLRVFFKQPLSTLEEHLFIIITFYAAVHSTSPWKIEYQITSQETRLSYLFFINLIVFPCVPTRLENLCDLNINIFPPDSFWFEGIYFSVNSCSKSYAFPVTKYFSTNYSRDAIKIAPE